MDIEDRLHEATTSLINGQRKQASALLYKGCKTNAKRAVERSLRFIEVLSKSGFSYHEAIKETNNLAKDLESGT